MLYKIRRPIEFNTSGEEVPSYVVHRHAAFQDRAYLGAPGQRVSHIADQNLVVQILRGTEQGQVGRVLSLLSYNIINTCRGEEVQDNAKPRQISLKFG